MRRKRGGGGVWWGEMIKKPRGRQNGVGGGSLRGIRGEVERGDGRGGGPE